MTPFSAFGDLIHAENIDDAETVWRHMMLPWIRERAVTVNNERWAFVHHLQALGVTQHSTVMIVRISLHGHLGCSEGCKQAPSGCVIVHGLHNRVIRGAGY